MEAVKAVQARVTGRVQGVSFRWWTRDEAKRLGVRGWVRNEADGSVLLHAEGEDAAVEALLARCQEGPPAARVARVTTHQVPTTGATAFEITH